MNRGHELRGAGCILLPGHAPQQLRLPMANLSSRNSSRTSPPQRHEIKMRGTLRSDPVQAGEAIVLDAVPRGIREPIVPHFSLGSAALRQNARTLGPQPDFTRNAAASGPPSPPEIGLDRFSRDDKAVRGNPSEIQSQTLAGCHSGVKQLPHRGGTTRKFRPPSTETTVWRHEAACCAVAGHCPVGRHSQKTSGPFQVNDKVIHVAGETPDNQAFIEPVLLGFFAEIRQPETRRLRLKRLRRTPRNPNRPSSSTRVSDCPRHLQDQLMRVRFGNG